MDTSMHTPVTADPTFGSRALEARPVRSARRELGRMFLILLAVTFVLRMPAFFVPVFNSDETFVATQAQVIREGGDLYEEATDRKPPLVPYIYAATFSFFGTSALWSVRVVAMFAIALTALLLAVEARRRYGERAGWIAGILFVLAMVAFAPQDGQAANFEVFMLPSMTAAILFARRGRGTAAGLCVAAATLAKQTGAATLLPVVYSLFRTRGRRGVGAALLGFGALVAAVAVAVGPRQLFYWAVLGNGSYLGVNSASVMVITMFVLMTLAWATCNLPLLWKLPAAWRERREPSRDGARGTDLWIWLASAALSVAIGLRFFGHYYFQLVPPLALIAAGALATSSRRAVRATIAVAAVFAIAYSTAGYFLHPFGPEPQYESVSRYVAANSHPDDEILVWGSEPEIYWASNLRPATRFLTTPTFLTGNHPGRPSSDKATTDADAEQNWEYFFEDFAKSPPRYLLDTSPSKLRGAQPISSFPRFAKLVKEQYRYVRTIDGVAVYTRR
jgi:4-amino-4-deoxy-L-arabinose transferase-like glycosyltransferase